MKLPRHVMVLNQIRVSNANALSGQFSIGFPGVSAFLGFVKALERTIQGRRSRIAHQHDVFMSRLMFGGVAIICHHNDLQASFTGQYNQITCYQRKQPEFLYMNGNTIGPHSKEIMRNAYTNFTVSLVVEIENLDDVEDDGCNDLLNGGDVRKYLSDLARQCASVMSLAGGVIEAIGDVTILNGHQDVPVKYGYALVSRHDLMKKEIDNGTRPLEALMRILAVETCWTREERMKAARKAVIDKHIDDLFAERVKLPEWAHANGGSQKAKRAATALRALLRQEEKDYISALREKWSAEEILNRDAKERFMDAKKKAPKNLIALHTGYLAVEAFNPGVVDGARDKACRFVFSEPLHSIGQWIGLHRIRSNSEDNVHIGHLLWRQCMPLADRDGSIKSGDPILFVNAYPEFVNQSEKKTESVD